MIWVAVVRPKQPLGLTAKASELSAKADFEARALVDDGAALRNRILGSPFSDE